MKFRVTIRKQGGADETREIDAPSRFAVYEEIEKEGATVATIDSVGGAHIPQWLDVKFGSGIKHAEVIRLAKNMSAMLTAGLSISRALAVLERQSSNKYLKKVVTGLSASVTKGSSFHEALAAFPNVFSPLFIAMTRAGEESGSLAEALSIVALQMDRAEELTRKIRGAMIYPSIVMVAIVIVAALMMIYVVPTLTKTFVELGVQIPLSTKIIVAVSNFMSHHVLAVFGLILLLVAGGYVFIRSRVGSRFMIFAALRTPVIGELVQETFAARAARTLSSLLTSGVPVLDALGITKEVVHAEAFARVIDEAETLVKKGDPLSQAFIAHPKLYPILMGDMLAVGEETGQVAPMLKQIAEYYEVDVNEKTKDLSTIIEPVLMLFIGGAVGIFAVSMIAPIYSLSSSI